VNPAIIECISLPPCGAPDKPRLDLTPDG